MPACIVNAIASGRRSCLDASCVLAISLGLLIILGGSRAVFLNEK